MKDWQFLLILGYISFGITRAKVTPEEYSLLLFSAVFLGLLGCWIILLEIFYFISRSNSLRKFEEEKLEQLKSDRLNNLK